MKARVNIYAFRETKIQSASLGVLGNVAHPLAEDGDYLGTVFQDGKEAAAFRLRVDAQVSSPQAEVDLAGMIARSNASREQREDAVFEVKSKGYLVLYVSEGPGGFHVVLARATPDKRARNVFDSRTLQQEDVFIVTLLRPGAYEMREEFGKAKGQIKVAYPKAGKRAFVAPNAVQVKVTSEAFDPSDVGLEAAQSVVFMVAAARASVTVGLVEPEDAPRKKDEGREKVRWTNPIPPRGESPGGGEQSAGTKKKAAPTQREIPTSRRTS